MSKCPHCGGPVRQVMFADGPKPHRNGTFEYQVPSTALGQFVHAMRGRPLKVPTQPTIIVRSEITVGKTERLLNNLELTINETQARELAHAYLTLGLDWSRRNTTTFCRSFSQRLHNQTTKEFMELRFLTKANKRLYILSDAGVRFLQHYA